MPRAKKEDRTTEPKKRSRTGCWPCKARKVKCGEEKPKCNNCKKNGEVCDYSIKLNWEGRSRRDKEGTLSNSNGFTFVATPSSVSIQRGHEHVFSSQHIATIRPPSGHSQRPMSRDASSQPIDHLRPPPSQYDAPYYSQPDRTPSTSATADWSPRGAAKRIRTSPQGHSASPIQLHHTDYTSPTSHFTPLSIDSRVHSPDTPSSSANSASPYAVPSFGTFLPQDPPDLRRLSVKSLLSDPAEDSGRPRYPRVDSHGCRTYGYDHGFPDLDIPHNDDHVALQQRSPDLRRASAAVSEISTASNELDQRDIAFEPGGYYAKPVAIRIPRILEPLPLELQQNNINLLYFHHFINHTARIMVPHDCPENPLRGVLPQMAIRNKQLLHLMLAFSAIHRARLLGHTEPANRIADWMNDVLPALREALDNPGHHPLDPNDLASLAPLATAIMLASLEIISPNTFKVPLTWQNHLDVARELLVSKGGLQRVSPQSDGMRDKAIFLISRWFAYLDVLGSLSGGKHRRPLAGAYLEDGGGLWLVNRNDEEIYQIDCLFGFSGRCIALLAAVADLAAKCDQQRKDPITGRQRPNWYPLPQDMKHALELRRRLEASAKFVSAGCMHDVVENPDVTTVKSEEDQDEILATNQAFHWAGMLHLSRRVIGLPREHAEVQDGVQKVIEALGRVRAGSSAESCLLFPMFTAGCECIDPRQHNVFLQRMKDVASWGMQHVARARGIMEKVWETGESWEVLVDGEFFG